MSVESFKWLDSTFAMTGFRLHDVVSANDCNDYRKDVSKSKVNLSPSSNHSSSRRQKRPWLIPTAIATVAFIGGVASNLVANYIQPKLDPYQRWVWAAVIIAMIVAIIAAIREARISGDPAQKSQSIVDGHITVTSDAGVDATSNTNIATGGNVVISHVQAQDQAQIIGRQEIHYHYSAPLRSASRQTEGTETEDLHYSEYKVFNLPGRRNEYFTGREDILLALETGFSGGKPAQALRNYLKTLTSHNMLWLRSLA